MHRHGLHRIQLSDGAQRLVWAIPRGSILPRAGGPTWDLDADRTDAAALRFRWTDVVDSLTRWIAGYQPPILLEHGAVGDSALGEVASWGVVTGAREVTAAEAADAGVAQAGDALYLTVEPVAAVADLLDAGQLPYTSPGLRADYVDDEGAHWPIILRELSLTRDPRQKRRQVPTTAAAQIGAALLSEVPMDPEIETETEIKTEGGDPLAELAAVVAGLADRVAALEAAAAPMAEPEPAAQMSEAAALRREIATLRAEREIDALLADRDLAPGARAHLIALHADGKVAAVKAIVAAAPKRGTTLHRAPLAGAAAALSDAPREQQARELAKVEKITVAEAWNRLASKGA